MTDFAPAIQTVYKDEAEIMRMTARAHEVMLRWKCTSVGETMLTELNYLMGMEPQIEIATITPRYLRPALSREVKMLQWAGVNIKKVWHSMLDTQKCEQITSTINLVSCLRRLNIHHEGLEAAFSTWVKNNQ